MHLGADSDDADVEWDQAEEKGSSKILERRVQALDSTANDFERLSETFEESGLPVAAARRSVQKEVQSKCLYMYMYDQCPNFLNW